jgi:hypothetical protein
MRWRKILRIGIFCANILSRSPGGLKSWEDKKWDFLKREIDLEGSNSLRQFCRENVKIAFFLFSLFSRTRRYFSDMSGKALGA